MKLPRARTFGRYDSASKARGAISRRSISSLTRKKAKGCEAELAREFANAHAAARRTRENVDRLKARLKANASGKPLNPSRQDPLLDRDLFLEIQRSLGAGDTIRLAHRKGGLVEDRSYPLHTVKERSQSQPIRVGNWEAIKRADIKRRRSGCYEKVLWAPHVDHIGENLQALSWGMAMEVWGRSVAVNLHLQPDLVERAKQEGPQATRFVRDRIRKSLVKAMKPFGKPAPDFFFVIEVSERGKEHLHGAIHLPTGPGVEDAVRKALLAAAGYAERHQTGRELNLRETFFAAGWINYCAKWMALSEERWGSPVFAASNGIRTAGRDWYRGAREEGLAIRPKGKTPDDGTIDLDAVAGRRIELPYDS